MPKPSFARPRPDPWPPIVGAAAAGTLATLCRVVVHADVGLLAIVAGLIVADVLGRKGGSR